MMRKGFVMAALICALAAAPAFTQVRVALVGNAALHFDRRPSASETAAAFASPDQPVFWGPGWEVVLDNVGLGGNYLVDFFKDDLGQWWVDWVTEAFFVSYHPFGAGSLLDPYVHFAVGCAGRASAEENSPVDRPVYLSIYPLLAAGLSLDLNGFLFGSRLSYVPQISPPPGTDYVDYPLERFQVAFYAGVALGGQRRGGRPAYMR